MGRLVTSGDLAVDVTKQYMQKYGENYKIRIKDYRKVAQFLFDSKLTTDWNRLLKSYLISVVKVSPEKIFFTTRNELYRVSKIEADSISVPERILDCIVGLRLKKNLAMRK